MQTAPRHRRPAGSNDGTDGNEWLTAMTAMTGGLLLVLLAAEGVTIAAQGSR